jgi:hypothetical protein
MKTRTKTYTKVEVHHDLSPSDPRKDMDLERSRLNDLTGQVLTCLAPTRHWSDDEGWWVRIEIGDVGVVVELMTFTSNAMPVYEVLLLRQRVKVFIAPESLHNITQWRLS